MGASPLVLCVVLNACLHEGVFYLRTVEESFTEHRPWNEFMNSLVL